MLSLLSVYKPVGLTPFQAIKKLKAKFPEYKNEKISYAGRLDPMAEGLLILLIGDENKNRNQYEDMEKEYEFEVSFGISTDTYDVLGLVDASTHSVNSGQASSAKNENGNEDNKEIGKKVIKNLQSFVGKSSQAYPPYSSKPVAGKPLYWWARENKLKEIKIPTKDIEIKKLRHLKTSYINDLQLKEIILKKIKLVDGDFRQEEILKTWERFFSSNKQDEFCVMKFSAVVTSGTYIRSLALKMGENIGVPSLAFSIKRTRVGDYSINSKSTIELE